MNKRHGSNAVLAIFDSSARLIVCHAVDCRS
jgi:hypothetical protein